MHWYMLEIFTDHDTDKDGIIKLAEFNAMMILQLLTPGTCHLVKEGLVSVPYAYLGHKAQSFKIDKADRQMDNQFVARMQLLFWTLLSL